MCPAPSHVVEVIDELLLAAGLDVVLFAADERAGDLARRRRRAHPLVAEEAPLGHVRHPHRDGEEGERQQTLPRLNLCAWSGACNLGCPQ